LCVVDVVPDEEQNKDFDEPFCAEMVIGPAILRNTNTTMVKRQEAVLMGNCDQILPAGALRLL
jgi:hypothetical protein